jgi:hypothetical protein
VQTSGICLPKDNDFSLSATPSKTSVAVGEEFEVDALFKNLTSNEYTIISGSSFSHSNLIDINVVELNEPEMMLVGSSIRKNIKPNQEVDDFARFKLDKPGKYKLYAVAAFEVIDVRTGQEKAYSIQAPVTLIEVK